MKNVIKKVFLFCMVVGLCPAFAMMANDNFELFVGTKGEGIMTPLVLEEFTKSLNDAVQDMGNGASFLSSNGIYVDLSTNQRLYLWMKNNNETMFFIPGIECFSIVIGDDSVLKCGGPSVMILLKTDKGAVKIVSTSQNDSDLSTLFTVPMNGMGSAWCVADQEVDICYVIPAIEKINSDDVGKDWEYFKNSTLTTPDNISFFSLEGAKKCRIIPKTED